MHRIYISPFFCLLHCIIATLNIDDFHDYRRLRSTFLPSHMQSPFAESGQYFCETSYLGLSYICDPGRVMSRSEAEIINEKVASIGLCTCDQWGNNSLRLCDRTASVAVAIMKNAYLPHVRTQKPKSQEQTEQDLLKSELERVNFIGLLYADILRQKWSTDSCPVDILLLSVIWHSANPFIKNRFYLYASFGSRIQLQASFIPLTALTELQDTDKPLSARIVTFLDTIDKFFHSISEPGPGNLPLFPKTELVLESKPWPPWAAVLFGSCILITIFAVLASSLVSQSYRSRFFARQSHVSIRMANKRWRAGFAGGVFGREDNSVPKKSIGNAMMFSRFSSKSSRSAPGATSYV